MWPPSSLKKGGKPDSAPGDGDGATEAGQVREEAILLDLRGAAAAFAISRRAFQGLRKRADFPENATVVLGPRCVRFRMQALQEFALSMASSPQRSPRQVERSRRRMHNGGAGAGATRTVCDGAAVPAGESPDRSRE